MMNKSLLVLFLLIFGIYSSAQDTINDIEGNVYKTIRIGDQFWMSENLKTTKFNDGNDIAWVNDYDLWNDLLTPAYCWYNKNIEADRITYGPLYNWFTVNTGKLCPLGWHVPGDNEWKILEIYLGMSKAESDTTGIRGDDAGSKLKEAGTKHWKSPNKGATNEILYTALPGGIRMPNGFNHFIGENGYWWTSTEHKKIYAWSRHLQYNQTGIIRKHYQKDHGISVRCVKD